MMAKFTSPILLVNTCRLPPLLAALAVENPGFVIKRVVVVDTGVRGKINSGHIICSGISYVIFIITTPKVSRVIMLRSIAFKQN
jgi:hypothetical protein